MSGTRLRRLAGTVLILGATALGLTGITSARAATAPATGSVTSTTAAEASTNDVVVVTTADAAETAQADTAPYAVGVTTVTLVDDTRSTAARGSTPASSTRTLSVTIRYPTTTGAHPLVIFVHGFGVSAETYAALEEDLAAAGFVVAAADFPLSSSALAGAPIRDMVDQAEDVSFIITSLLDPTTVPAILNGNIAGTSVAVIGHSDGGVTAAGVAYNDQYAESRIGAAVVLSGAEAFFPGTWFSGASPALLAVHGLDDETNPFSASERLFDDATGTKLLVGVEGGSHLGPFTTDAGRVEIDTLIADFLHAQLEGDAAAAGRLQTDAEAGPLTLVAASA